MSSVHWKSAIVVKMEKTAGCDSFTSHLKKEKKKKADISTTRPTVGCLVRLYLFMKSQLDWGLFFFFCTEEWITQIERSRQTGVKNRMCQIKFAQANHDLDQDAWDHIVNIRDAARKTVASEGWENRSHLPPPWQSFWTNGCQKTRACHRHWKKTKNLRTGNTNENKEVFSLNKMAQRPILIVLKCRWKVSDPGI